MRVHLSFQGIYLNALHYVYYIRTFLKNHLRPTCPVLALLLCRNRNTESTSIFLVQTGGTADTLLCSVSIFLVQTGGTVDTLLCSLSIFLLRTGGTADALLRSEYRYTSIFLVQTGGTAELKLSSDCLQSYDENWTDYLVVLLLRLTQSQIDRLVVY